MTNWLADPGACAIKAIKKGCNVLTGREETMSRITKVSRSETPKGSRYEFGNLFVEVEGKPGENRRMRAGSEETIGRNTNTVGTSWLNPEQANTMSDLLRAAYVNAGGSACGGKTLLEVFWDEMMVVTERLMTDQAAEDDVGAARSLAWVIATIQNPYRPNVDSVRDQVMTRWEAENQEQEEEQPKPTRAQLRAARRRRRA